MAASQERPAATRSEQMEAVAEMVAAGSALLLDWTQGSVQRVRVTDCGFSRCDYASCRLANAITEYLRLADKEDESVAAS